MGLQPGTIIPGNIRLESLLGMGGMGSVWIAEHLGLKTRVAVKFMSPESVQRKNARERFEREAAAAAQIKSPHVVHVSDYGITPDGIPYIVMELLEGEDLDDVLDRTTILDVPSLVEVVGQVCKALASAHARGIVHRDIKPDNIFLLRSDDHELFVKLLDFGIAKQMIGDVTRMTTTGHLAGTPHYMSPEQVAGAEDLDQRSDLWSLAVVAYRALTGRVPFDANTMAALGVAIHSGVFVPPSQHRPDLPPLIDVWMARALARDRDARFSSAKEMADELRVAAGMPRLARLRDVHSSSVLGPGPSSPTRMDAALSAFPGTRGSSLWKVAVVLGVSIGSLGGFFLVRAALKQPAEAEVEAVAPSTREPPVAPSAIVPEPLPPPEPEFADAGGAASAEAPAARSPGHRAFSKPKPAGTSTAKPAEAEPEDYGF
jgi:serine/threonine-protein kinase